MPASGLTHLLKRAARAGIGSLFPLVCGGCERPGSSFCPDCLRKSLATSPDPPRPHRLSGVAAVGLHEDPLRKAVLGLKFSGETETATILGRMLAAELLRRQPQWAIEIVTPMPLHWRRSLKRGYNQCELLADAASRVAGIPVQRLLKRKWNTRPQSELGAVDRRSNLKDAFACARPDRAAGRTILLLDDVMTTGSTLTNAAAALRASGAAAVYALVVTWEPLYHQQGKPGQGAPGGCADPDPI